jgi:UPF0755 protein
MFRIKEWWNEGVNTRTITLCFLFVPVCIYVYVLLFYPTPYAKEKTYITIEKAEPLSKTISTLVERRIISSPFLLKVILLASGNESHVFAGDYYFADAPSLYSVYTRITTGNFGINAVRFTVREGDTVNMVAKECEKLFFRCSAQTFKALAASYEGYLFPDTYFVSPNVTEQVVINLLVDTLYKKVEPYKKDIASNKRSFHDILTLASIVEKEENDIPDRRLIAGILNNRLAMRMPLQVDATFLYIMGKGSAELSRKDLAKDSPYNTYVYAGIPPGPIGSPALSSILAVLYPKNNPFLFYLADRHGTTYYSKTYEEHLKKKAEYIDRFR